MDLFKKIIDFIFGYKYYAVVMNRCGTGVCTFTDRIYKTRKEAEEKREQLAMNMTFQYVETVSFRSRLLYN